MLAVLSCYKYIDFNSKMILLVHLDREGKGESNIFLQKTM